MYYVPTQTNKVIKMKKEKYHGYSTADKIGDFHYIDDGAKVSHKFNLEHFGKAFVTQVSSDGIEMDVGATEKAYTNPKIRYGFSALDKSGKVFAIRHVYCYKNDEVRITGWYPNGKEVHATLKDISLF